MSERCPNPGWNSRHKFEPRYDVAPATELESISVDGYAALKLVCEALQKKTYVRDVCVYCGETVERK